MANKATQTSKAAPAAARKSGKIYCYIGPNIRGYLHSGQVFRGERDAVLQGLAGVAEQYPLVKTLLVSGENLPVARLKVKEPGNAYYANFQKLSRALLEEAQNKADKEATMNA